MWFRDELLDRIAKTGALVLLLWLGALVLLWFSEATSNSGFLPRPEFGWAEFWINRYQQLIAAIIAFVIAAVGAWLLFK